tara:strand:+ start:14 stop:169 length:156 start_codon:yes stop_codon:yes gene_type:complete
MKIIVLFMNMLYFVNGHVEDATKSVSKGLQNVATRMECVPVGKNDRNQSSN